MYIYVYLRANDSTIYLYTVARNPYYYFCQQTKKKKKQHLERTNKENYCFGTCKQAKCLLKPLEVVGTLLPCFIQNISYVFV